MLASSSTICTLLRAGDQQKRLLPTMNPLGVNVSCWPRAPQRGSNETPNPIALPQALHHHRVSGTCWKVEAKPGPQCQGSREGQAGDRSGFGWLAPGQVTGK